MGVFFHLNIFFNVRILPQISHFSSPNQPPFVKPTHLVNLIFALILLIIYCLEISWRIFHRFVRNLLDLPVGIALWCGSGKCTSGRNCSKELIWITVIRFIHPHKIKVLREWNVKFEGLLLRRKGQLDQAWSCSWSIAILYNLDIPSSVRAMSTAQLTDTLYACSVVA